MKFDDLLGYQHRDSQQLSEQEDADRYLPVTTSEPASPYLKAALVAMVCFGGMSAALMGYKLLTADPVAVESSTVADEPSAEVVQLHQPAAAETTDSASRTRMAVTDRDMELAEMEEEPDEPEPDIEPEPEPIASQPAPRPTPTPDPMQLLQQVTAMGSYGQIEEAPVGFVSPSTEAAIAGDPSATPDLLASRVPQPSHQLSAQLATDTQPSPDFDQQSDPPSNLQIDLGLEREFLNGISPRAIASGSMATGTIAAPVVWSASTADGSAERFVVRLDSPLHDGQGLPAIPTGSELVVQVDGIDGNGVVRLSGVAVVLNLNQRQEIPLQPGAVTVRGEGGQALLAQGDERLDAGPDIAAQETGLFVLGALGEVGELLNRPSSTTSASTVSGFGGTTFSQETNDGVNVLGGVLAGGTEAIIPGIQQRTQQSIEEASERERLWVVEAGQAVTVAVNREIRL